MHSFDGLLLPAFGFGVQGLGLISEHVVYLKVQIPHGPYCMLGTYGRVGAGGCLGFRV